MAVRTIISTNQAGALEVIRNEGGITLTTLHGLARQAVLTHEEVLEFAKNGSLDVTPTPGIVGLSRVWMRRTRSAATGDFTRVILGDRTMIFRSDDLCSTLGVRP